MDSQEPTNNRALIGTLDSIDNDVQVLLQEVQTIKSENEQIQAQIAQVEADKQQQANYTVLQKHDFDLYIKQLQQNFKQEKQQFQSELSQISQQLAKLQSNFQQLKSKKNTQLTSFKQKIDQKEQECLKRLHDKDKKVKVHYIQAITNKNNELQSTLSTLEYQLNHLQGALNGQTQSTKRIKKPIKKKSTGRKSQISQFNRSRSPKLQTLSRSLSLSTSFPTLDDLSHTIVILEQKQAYLQAKIAEISKSNSRCHHKYKSKLSKITDELKSVKSLQKSLIASYIQQIKHSNSLKTLIITPAVAVS